ncbi:MAG: glycosyltransferase family 2 protein [Gammaproteobacteria bacterium]
MPNPSVTAIVLTFNEENNIKSCLRNLTWTDRIVIVDSGSTDKTVEYASEFDCDIYCNPWPGFAGQRNWALDHTDVKTEWVIFIDADEEVTPAMRQEIETTLKGTDYCAFYICYKVIFLGKWVKHSSNYPVWHPRIVRKGKVRFRKAITGHGETWDVKGKVGYINEPYIHYTFSKGLSFWFEKHNRLSSLECQAYFDKKRNFSNVLKNCLSSDKHIKRQGLRAMSYYLPFRPFFRFVYLLIFRGGILDGPAGWTYCTLYLAYEIMISAKIKEKSYLFKEKSLSNN